MKQKVDLLGPKKYETKFFNCPKCGGLAIEVRSKRTRIELVNDENKQVTDKKWSHRGIVCLKTCGAFPASAALASPGQQELFPVAIGKK